MTDLSQSPDARAHRGKSISMMVLHCEPDQWATWLDRGIDSFLNACGKQDSGPAIHAFRPLELSQISIFAEGPRRLFEAICKDFSRAFASIRPAIITLLDQADPKSAYAKSVFLLELANAFVKNGPDAALKAAINGFVTRTLEKPRDYLTTGPAVSRRTMWDLPGRFEMALSDAIKLTAEPQEATRMAACIAILRPAPK